MPSEDQFDSILEKVDASDLSGFALRSYAMGLVNELDTYNWSGIYRLDGNYLKLDAYVGAPTEHTRIQVGVGVCGTAVAKEKNQVVDDVREIANYLSCSISTRSEIVVLIRDAGGKVIGQIDIDGHQVGAFDAADEAFLDKLGDILSKRWA